MALRQQAAAEVARARSDLEASRAARSKTDADAAGAKIRSQAEADAARIRADAVAAASRTKAEAAAAPVTATPETTKAALPPPKPEVPVTAPPPAIAAPVAAEKAARVAANHAATYDGNWNVTVVCSSTPDGALGYTLVFVAQVKDGFLRGEYGVEGTTNSLKMQGPIQPDGSARLDARGITGDQRYSVNGVAKGSPYKYTVAATFDAASGSGRRLELRTCDVRFAKQ
jgi:hypothetical protein